MENRMGTLVNMRDLLANTRGLSVNMMAMLVNSLVKLVCNVANTGNFVVCRRQHTMDSLMCDWIWLKYLAMPANKPDWSVSNVAMMRSGLLANMPDWPKK